MFKVIATPPTKEVSILYSINCVWVKDSDPNRERPNITRICTDHRIQWEDIPI